MLYILFAAQVFPQTFSNNAQQLHKNLTGNAFDRLMRDIRL